MSATTWKLFDPRAGLRDLAAGEPTARADGAWLVATGRIEERVSDSTLDVLAAVHPQSDGWMAIQALAKGRPPRPVEWIKLPFTEIGARVIQNYARANAGYNVYHRVTAYREANALLPNSPLILVAMSHAMVETADPASAKEAQAALQKALANDPEDPFAWDLAAKSYLQSDQPGLSAYAAAERALLVGEFGDVVRYSRESERLLEKGTPTWYRLQDIKVSAQNSLQELMERRRR